MAQNRTFLALIAVVSLAFAWVLWPLFGAVFWAVSFVIVLNPLAQQLVRRMGQRSNLAALIMVAGFLLLIILPMLLIMTAVVAEATSIIAAVQSGEIDLHGLFQTMLNILPEWVQAGLLQLGFGDLTAVQSSVTASVSEWIGSNAPAVLSFGKNTAEVFVGLCVMLYLMFFLFRDGEAIMARIKAAIPMEPAMLQDLLSTFTLVVRATVRGDILVALLQGGLG